LAPFRRRADAGLFRLANARRANRLLHRSTQPDKPRRREGCPAGEERQRRDWRGSPGPLPATGAVISQRGWRKLASISRCQRQADTAGNCPHAITAAARKIREPAAAELRRDEAR